MGHRLHIPFDGAKVGALRVDDPRAKLARIQIDEGRGDGFVDVTRGYIKRSFDGGESVRCIVIAAHDVEGWIAYIDKDTGLIVGPVYGDVKITFEPSTEARQLACDHKFVDSASCLKCGWTPPAATDKVQ